MLSAAQATNALQSVRPPLKLVLLPRPTSPMAPVPEHLKRPVPTDVSSHILTKIGDTPYKHLTADTARTWVAELENSIQQTKVSAAPFVSCLYKALARYKQDRIYERIQQDLPDFNRQLESSQSVQTRLSNLTSNLNTLEGKLSDPQVSNATQSFTPFRHILLAQ